ncbi:P-loop containing nucleoside triphosphate hydrolase [Cryptosporidium felis]|nr:P-loop containing nucleoside triphosphate hydrolase [Cryptosporidium felis]
MRFFALLFILGCVAARADFESSRPGLDRDSQPLELFQVDRLSNNVKVPLESIERMRRIQSPVSVTSVLGSAGPSRPTPLNLIWGSSHLFGSQSKIAGGWWALDADSSAKSETAVEPRHILVSTESLIVGKGVNASLRVAILALIISDSVLISSFSGFDLLAVDFVRLLINQAVMFSSLLLKKLNELSIPNKRALRRNLVFLIENLHKTRISWIFHEPHDSLEATDVESFSKKCRAALKSKLEMYVWPESSQSGVFRSLSSFIDKSSFLKMPLLNGNNPNSETALDFSDRIREFSRSRLNGQKRLTGSQLADILELFSEQAGIFGSLRPMELGVPRNDPKTTVLVENTLLIFGSRLEDQLLGENSHPLLEIEAEAIYNSTLKDIESYWSSISEFDLSDPTALLKSIQPHFERQYRSILGRNCELIRSHCQSVIDSHLSDATRKIDQFKEKIPVSQKLLTEFARDLESSLKKDVEATLNRSFEDFELSSSSSSYGSSPCCQIDRGNTKERIEQALLGVREKNRIEVEKILVMDFDQAVAQVRSMEDADESFLKASRGDFERKLESLKESSRKVFNRHLALVNETELHARFRTRLNSELDGFALRKIVEWERACRKFSKSFAKAISIRQNISIRNKLTLPLGDSVILEAFRNLKNEVLEEMKGIYCYGEPSWNEALRELMSIIEDDREQLMKENLIALKNLLHRPLKYALRNALEVQGQFFSWSNFVKEARIAARNSLEESDGWGSFKMDEKTKERVIDLWAELDLLGLRRSFLRSQFLAMARYLMYSVIFTVIIFVSLFRKASKLLLGVVFSSFMGSIALFSWIELGVGGEAISQKGTELLRAIGIPRFLIHYFRHNIAVISAVIAGLTSIAVYDSILFKYNGLGPSQEKSEEVEDGGEERRGGSVVSPSARTLSGGKPGNQNKENNGIRTFVY